MFSNEALQRKRKYKTSVWKKLKNNNNNNNEEITINTNKARNDKLEEADFVP